MFDEYIENVFYIASTNNIIGFSRTIKGNTSPRDIGLQG
jgi:hypothetical protein